MNVRVTKLDPRAVIPAYQTEGAGAFDLTVIEDAVVPTRSSSFLRTGLVFGIPQDHVMLIFARSSLFKKFGLMLTNNVGVLDADFCGPEDECYISVWNPSDLSVHVAAGTRLAQAIILPRPKATFEEGPALGPSRGGWGSTGGHGEPTPTV
jgi:dUTP pyrophosphatase